MGRNEEGYERQKLENNNTEKIRLFPVYSRQRAEDVSICEQVKFEGIIVAKLDKGGVRISASALQPHLCDQADDKRDHNVLQVYSDNEARGDS